MYICTHIHTCMHLHTYVCNMPPLMQQASNYCFWNIYVDPFNNRVPCKVIMKLCSKFPYFSIPNFSQNPIMFNFVLCAGYSINIPYLQFKLPNKVSYFSYLMLVELLKKYSFHFLIIPE